MGMPHLWVLFSFLQDNWWRLLFVSASVALI